MIQRQAVIASLVFDSAQLTSSCAPSITKQITSIIWCVLKGPISQAPTRSAYPKHRFYVRICTHQCHVSSTYGITYGGMSVWIGWYCTVLACNATQCNALWCCVMYALGQTIFHYRYRRTSSNKFYPKAFTSSRLSIPHLQTCGAGWWHDPC